jgi:hypothetical protein
MLNFYLFSTSPPSVILSFFLFLSISESRKTAENKRWVGGPIPLFRQGSLKNLMFLIRIYTKTLCYEYP